MSERTCAVKTTIQALRFALWTASRICSHASLTCWVVTGPTGTTRVAGAGTAAAAAAGSWPRDTAAGGVAGTGRAGTAGATAPACADVAPWKPSTESLTPTRRSRRSTRASAPRSEASLDGTRMRAIISSRWRRGDVAPVISVRAALTMSAERDSSAAPNLVAWTLMRSSSSCGTPRRTAAVPSALVAATTMRSRSRSRRSSTKRRGSCPVWITRSTAANAPAASRTPMASTTSSRRAAWV